MTEVVDSGHSHSPARNQSDVSHGPPALGTATDRNASGVSRGPSYPMSVSEPCSDWTSAATARDQAQSASDQQSLQRGSTGATATSSRPATSSRAATAVTGATGSRGSGTGHTVTEASTERRKLDVVAAGHASRGGSDIQVDRPGTILKILDDTEHEVYKNLKEKYWDDPVYDFTPRYHGELQDVDEEGKPISFLRISNVLTGFCSPKVIDVKLGVRTFLESECSNLKPRPDLYKRMCDMYPDAPTPEERQAEAVTKHRWMTVRDSQSTIQTMGFRIDGIAGYRKKKKPELDKQLEAVSTSEHIRQVLVEFAQVAATDDGDSELLDERPSDVAEEVLMHLEKLLVACKESAFVKEHEFIGSSLLVIADAYGNAGVSWIDFAKTRVPPEGIELTHKDPWELGNHEDGILTGLGNLVETWREVIHVLKRSETPALSIVDSVKLRTQRAACCCVKWRRTMRRKQRQERAAKMAHQSSDIQILSALPAFQGKNGVVDPQSMRRVVDVIGAVSTGVAGAAVGAVEAVGTIATGVQAGVADAAESVRKRVAGHHITWQSSSEIPERVQEKGDRSWVPGRRNSRKGTHDSSSGCGSQDAYRSSGDMEASPEEVGKPAQRENPETDAPRAKDAADPSQASTAPEPGISHPEAAPPKVDHEPAIHSI